MDLVGFHTGRPSRLIADLKLQEILATRSIGYISDMICVNKTIGRRAPDVKRMLAAQLGALVMYEESSCKHGTSAYITSTYNSEGTRINGVHDDLQRALSMGIIVTYLFFGRKLPLDYNWVDSLQEMSKNYESDFNNRKKNVMGSMNKIDAYRPFMTKDPNEHKRRKYKDHFEYLESDEEDETQSKKRPIAEVKHNNNKKMKRVVKDNDYEDE